MRDVLAPQYGRLNTDVARWPTPVVTRAHRPVKTINDVRCCFTLKVFDTRLDYTPKPEECSKHLWLMQFLGLRLTNDCLTLTSATRTYTIEPTSPQMGPNDRPGSRSFGVF